MIWSEDSNEWPGISVLLILRLGSIANFQPSLSRCLKRKEVRKKNLRRWLSSWPAYIIGKARQGLSLAHLPVGTVVSTARLGNHSVGKTLAFCPLCLKYFSSGHSHSQDIWNRRWHWFGSSCAVHYVHHHALLKWYRAPRHLISSWPSSSLKHNRDS